MSDENEGRFMEIKRKLLIHGLALALIVIFSPLAKATSPPICLAYAYTQDGENSHLSLVSSESYLFGQSLTVISSCNNTELIVNGQKVASSNNYKLNYYLDKGDYNIELISGNESYIFTNVSIISNGQLNVFVNNLPNSENPYALPYTIEEIDSIELMSGVGAIILSWFLITSILWRIINQYHEKNYCEEVSS